MLDLITNQDYNPFKWQNVCIPTVINSACPIASWHSCQSLTLGLYLKATASSILVVFKPGTVSLFQLKNYNEKTANTQNT